MCSFPYWIDKNEALKLKIEIAEMASAKPFENKYAGG